MYHKDSTSSTVVATKSVPADIIGTDIRSAVMQRSSSLELGLVKQIRYNILPMESLRELSEEIGFVAEDLLTFNKMLEVGSKHSVSVNNRYYLYFI